MANPTGPNTPGLLLDQSLESAETRHVCETRLMADLSQVSLLPLCTNTTTPIEPFIVRVKPQHMRDTAI